MSIKVKKQSSTTTTTVMEVRPEELRRLLKEAGYEVPDRQIRVYVNVPGGGDWSHCELDISGKTPLIVEWTETVTEPEIDQRETT